MPRSWAQTATFAVAAFSCLLILEYSLTLAEDDEAFTERSDTRLGTGTHIMNIYYCYSCGYKKAFDDYAGIIQHKYPEISVLGSNYDPPGMKMFLSRFISLGKMVVIMCILSGFNIAAWLNKPQPAWWSWCLENKVYACMMVFFISNMVEGQLVASGAFEISLDNIPLWSKIETGRIPQPPELFHIIDNTLHFSKMDMPAK